MHTDTQTYELKEAFCSMKSNILREIMSSYPSFFVRRNDKSWIVNELCLDSLLCRPIILTGRGAVALQSATGDQSNLLLLALAQDTTGVTMPISANMLSVTQSNTCRKTHTVGQVNVHVLKITVTPSVHLINVTHTHSLISSHDGWFHSAKLQVLLSTHRWKDRGWQQSRKLPLLKSG